MYGNDFDNAQTLIQRFVLTNPQIPQTPTQSPEPHFKSPPPPHFNSLFKRMYAD